jgi:hypothetical protein
MIGLTHRMRWLRRVFVAVAGATFLASHAVAQSPTGQSDHDLLTTETYVRPPAVVDRIIMAQRTDITFVQPSPDRKWFLKSPGLDRGDVAQFGKPHIYLGGIQVDAHANRARSLTTSTHLGLILVDPRTNTTKTIETPKGASISSQVWSPTGTQVAYIANFDDASHVFVADVATGKSVQVTKTPLLATLVTTLEWTADGKSIVAVAVPEARGPAPVHGKNGIEDGPEVRLSESRVIPQAIHPSLLEDPHEKAMLKYYTTGQVVLIDVKTKVARKIGAPGMIRAVDASPDGQFFRVTRMTEPFSYLVPVTNFGSIQELWDLSGKVVATLNKQPLREGESAGDADVPAGGGRGGPQQTAADTGKRNINWNPVGPGLVYYESVFAAGRNGAGGATGAAAAPAGGGRGGRGGGRGGAAVPAAAGRGTAPARPAPMSVRYMSWVAPFGAGDTRLIYEGSGQLTNVAFSYDGKTMFVSDSGAVIALRSADPSKRYNLGRGVTVPAAGGGRRRPGRRRRCIRRHGRRHGHDGRRSRHKARAERRAGRDRRERQQDGLSLRHARPRFELGDAGSASVGGQARLRGRHAQSAVRESSRHVRRVRHRARRRLLRVHLHARVADGDPGRVPARREGRDEHADHACEGRCAGGLRCAAQANPGHPSARRNQVLGGSHLAGGLEARHAPPRNHLVLSARVHDAGGI